MNMMKSQSILIRNVPGEEHEALKSIAKRRDSDVSKIIRRLIKRYVLKNINKSTEQV